MSKIILAVVVIVVIVLFMRRSGGDPKLAEFNKEQGQTYLEENAKNVNVNTTDSGLQYEVLTQGTGTEHPTATDRVKVHYHGTLIDGTVFDSSVDRGEPISFGLNQVIKGWTEGVQLMVVGEKSKFTIPSEIAYGNRAAGKIPPGSVLVFEIELLGINE
jgi:peptidylprolyl isomerase